MAGRAQVTCCKKFLRRTHKCIGKSNFLEAREILQTITQGNLFGLVECDIEVPRWDAELIEYFEQFPPICKSAEITIDDIGEHMKDYALENGYMSKPRRNLINSFWAKKILLTTPIVQWMLKKGLMVSRIYQFIEFKPKSCFGKICDKVTAERRN